MWWPEPWARERTDAMKETGFRRAVSRATAAIAALTGGVVVAAGSALGSAAGTSQTPRVLPESFGPPVRLAAGSYRTRPGFAPVTTFTVGRGWYGGGSRRDWAVGKGVNQVEQRFGSAGIWVSPLSLRYATAVARFRALKTLEAGRSEPIRIGGYSGVVFHAKVMGDQALLPGVAPGLDVVNTPGGHQIFLNVRGTTILFRIEVFALRAGTAAVLGFLKTLRFPR